METIQSQLLKWVDKVDGFLVCDNSISVIFSKLVKQTVLPFSLLLHPTSLYLQFHKSALKSEADTYFVTQK